MSIKYLLTDIEELTAQEELLFLDPTSRTSLRSTPAPAVHGKARPSPIYQFQTDIGYLRGLHHIRLCNNCIELLKN